MSIWQLQLYPEAITGKGWPILEYVRIVSCMSFAGEQTFRKGYGCNVVLISGILQNGIYISGAASVVTVFL